MENKTEPKLLTVDDDHHPDIESIDRIIPEGTQMVSVDITTKAGFLEGFCWWDNMMPHAKPTLLRRLLRFKHGIQLWLYRRGLPLAYQCNWCGTIWNVDDDGVFVLVDIPKQWHKDLIPLCPGCANNPEADLYIQRANKLGWYSI